MSSVHQETLSELKYLLETSPPSFIFVDDPSGPRTTARALTSMLSSVNGIRFVVVDAIACFTLRLLFDAVLNGLAQWTPNWSEGCANWPGTTGFVRYSESLDAFVHGLKAVHGFLTQNKEPSRLAICIENAERLKEKLPELIIPLTRLAEIAQLDICVILHSAVSWEDIRPPLGAAQDPYYIDILVPEKEVVVEYMLVNFQAYSQEDATELTPYHPNLASAYQMFSSILYDTCSPFTSDPEEMIYIASARWPGFIQPVLDNYLHDNESNGDMDVDDPGFTKPTSDVILRLIRYFKPTLSEAVEQLYPRLTDAKAWADSHQPTEDALLHAYPARVSTKDSQFQENPLKETIPSEYYKDLTRMAKFILISSYIASMNPAKSDLRMFGRGIDEKKRKRRRITRKIATKPKSGPVKIPQRFVGPALFPLDRMLAILGAILEENDNDDEERPSKNTFSIPGEYTNMEISRVGVYCKIIDLTSAQLLYRTTAADKLDGPPTFKCGVSYNVAQSLSKELNVPLNDLLWDIE